MRRFTLFLFTALLMMHASPTHADPANPSADAPRPATSARGEHVRRFYEPSRWQPRVILPAADALSGTFYPATPRPEGVHEIDADFVDARLSRPPAPGVHPRVLLTPDDVETIRERIAAGDSASVPFRSMWERVSRKRGPLYALIAQDHELGRQLAADFMTKVRALGPKLDAMETYPDRENLWSVEKSMSAAGDPRVPSDIWQLPNYDLLYQWLTEDERKIVRETISRVTTNRISNFLAVPDHYMINNHQCFGMSMMPLLLCIEGEEGFDERIYKLGVRKMRAMLDFYLTRDGMCYETIKGWLPVSAYVAVGRREPSLLKHAHLQGKVSYFLQSLRYERMNLARPMAWQPPAGMEASFRIRDEMRASAFHFIWMMKYFRPQHRGLDLLYHASLASHDFLTSPDARWPDPVGIDEELLLLFADHPIRDDQGKEIDWRDQREIDSLNLPLTWHDDQRGYLIARNSWKPDDLTVGFAVKSEYYYGGHEGAEHGRFVLWSDGVNWAFDNDALWHKHGGLQNQITVDGMSCRWPPVAGQWLGVRDSPEGVSASGDYKDGYSFYKSTQIHPLDFPSASTTYNTMFSTGNYTLTRGIQLAYHDEMVRFYDGFAHTDYGTWSGEHRLLDGYRPWNPMRQAYRTFHLARGEHPYVMIFDDVQKDDERREYAWNMVLPDDVQLLRVIGAPDTLGGVMPNDPHVAIDLILGRIDTPRNATNRIFTQPLFQPKVGAPQLLVRVLRRHTNGWTLPRVEQVDRFNVLTIPASTRSPDFIVMLFPHRAGDPLPETRWSDDGSAIHVRLGEQRDTYHLRRTDGGRTGFAFTRNDRLALASNTPPPAPTLMVRGQSFHPSDARYTREENRIPRHVFDDSIEVRFKVDRLGTRIHYTLDGSEPGPDSPRYALPIRIDRSATLKAKIIESSSLVGPSESRTTTATFERRTPATPIASPDGPGQGFEGGIEARVYEIKTVLYDDRGFWHADRVMLPDLDRHEPIFARRVESFTLPHVGPQSPLIEQRKGFYRFTGRFLARRSGTYRFAVNSCGPITLDVGGQVAIEHLSSFHTQQDVRRGEVVLGAGWHEIELVVTDPLFWKIQTDDIMPFDVQVAIDDEAFQRVSPTDLASRAAAALSIGEEPKTPRLEPVKLDIELTAGVERRDYDLGSRYVAFAPPLSDWLDVDELRPIQVGPADVMVTNSSDALVVTYEGFFYAPEQGVYTFDLPARADEVTTGDQVRTGSAADRNQLRIGGEVVVQRGIPGRHPNRRVELSEAGFYPISIRLGRSRAGGSVTFPSGDTFPLEAAGLFRPVRPTIAPVGVARMSSHYELYEDQDIAIELPDMSDRWTIRYTTDGTTPGKDSPTYSRPIRVSESLTLSAAGFDGDRQVTLPAVVRLSRVDAPEFEMLAHVKGDSLAMESLNADRIPVQLKESKPVTIEAWFDQATSIASPDKAEKSLLAFLQFHGGSRSTQAASTAIRAVDPNLDKGTSGAGVRFSNIKSPRNAVTVSLWIRLGAVNEGRLFGKWGYNSIGKRFRSIAVELRNGRLRVDPGAIMGGSIKAGTWHHVAVTADGDAIQVYVDGVLAGRGPGTDSVLADSLDFAVHLPSDVRDLRMFGRVLDPKDVAQLAKDTDR